MSNKISPKSPKTPKNSKENLKSTTVSYINQHVSSVLSSDDLTKAIAKVKTSGKKYRELCHMVAIQCVVHAISPAPDDQSRACNNFTPLDNLRKSLGNNTLETQLVKWVEKYTPARLAETDKGLTFRLNGSKKKLPVEEQYDLKEAIENPFYDVFMMSPEDFKQLSLEDIQKRVTNLISSIDALKDYDTPEQAQEDGKSKMLNPEDRESILAFSETLKSTLEVA
jgi:hypothetical protein